MVQRSSPRSTFWAAAHFARNPKVRGRARRRALLILMVLALRPDHVGGQARAVLSPIRGALEG